MAQSSVPHGFTTTILVPSGNSDYATIATIVQSELKPLGINVNDPASSTRTRRTATSRRSSTTCR